MNKDATLRLKYTTSKPSPVKSAQDIEETGASIIKSGCPFYYGY